MESDLFRSSRTVQYICGRSRSRSSTPSRPAVRPVCFLGLDISSERALAISHPDRCARAPTEGICQYVVAKPTRCVPALEFGRHPGPEACGLGRRKRCRRRSFVRSSARAPRSPGHPAAEGWKLQEHPDIHGQQEKTVVGCTPPPVRRDLGLAGSARTGRFERQVGGIVI
ncbi:hypothetical protein OH77DRAFT_244742 [Trametes cingulata]|nr:hypothetical protein OH77DRAFT_244742 [Trametes cingulata]